MYRVFVGTVMAWTALVTLILVIVQNSSTTEDSGSTWEKHFKKSFIVF